jgi:hypothetical protein
MSPVPGPSGDVRPGQFGACCGTLASRRDLVLDEYCERIGSRNIQRVNQVPSAGKYSTTPPHLYAMHCIDCFTVYALLSREYPQETLG